MKVSLTNVNIDVVMSFKSMKDTFVHILSQQCISGALTIPYQCSASSLAPGASHVKYAIAETSPSFAYHITLMVQWERPLSSS